VSFLERGKAGTACDGIFQLALGQSGCDTFIRDDTLALTVHSHGFDCIAAGHLVFVFL
jgi:hypothetical protein